MGIFDFLRKPKYETTEELLSLEGKKRNDWIVTEFARLLEERMLLLGKQKMTQDELTVLAVEGLEVKVNNDGYHGFFSHSTKEFVPIIVESLQRIKASKVAELTEKAINQLKIKGAITEEKVENAIEARDKELMTELSQFDTKYYEMEIDLADKVLKFIKQHKDNIHIK